MPPCMLGSRPTRRQQQQGGSSSKRAGGWLRLRQALTAGSRGTPTISKAIITTAT